MSTYVLVHGAWHGSWCWNRVRKILQERGHEVYTPTLTGLAERSHLLSPEVNLETHSQDVLNLIQWEQLSDVVLCGHSYGGCVISSVADRIPERIRSLVYLDAFVLEHDENLFHYIPEAPLAQLLKVVENVGDGWQIPPIPAAALNVNVRDREWVDRQCTMQPVETFRQRISLGGGINEIQNNTFIRAKGYVEGSPFSQFFEKAKSKGWRTLTMACGHDAMLDEPENLARILEA